MFRVKRLWWGMFFGLLAYLGFFGGGATGCGGMSGEVGRHTSSMSLTFCSKNRFLEGEESPARRQPWLG